MPTPEVPGQVPPDNPLLDLAPLQGVLLREGSFEPVGKIEVTLRTTIEETIAPVSLVPKLDYHFLLDTMVIVAQCTGQPLGALFADVNGLKSINDELGHDAGDEAIDTIGQLFASLPHTTGHIGGDEFALAATTDEDGMAEIVVQLRSSFENEMARPKNRPLSEQGIGLAIGTSNLGPGMTGRQLLASADNAMYADKISQLPDLNPDQREAFYAARELLRDAGIHRLRDVLKYALKYPERDNT